MGTETGLREGVGMGLGWVPERDREEGSEKDPVEGLKRDSVKGWAKNWERRDQKDTGEKKTRKRAGRRWRWVPERDRVEGSEKTR